MAERTPIFSTKGGTQIGYGVVFDLLSTRRCNYNAATGNLSTCITGKIVGYVSIGNNFVVPSRIASELFEQPGGSEAPIASLTEGEQPEEYATKGNRPALGEPTDAFLERAMGMIRGAIKNETP